MTSLPRAAWIIVFWSCRVAGYGIARPALPWHDDTLQHDARIWGAVPKHSQLIAGLASSLSPRRGLSQSPAATIITKSP